MPTGHTEQTLRRKLRARARRSTVTVDDATALLRGIGARPTLRLIRRVLRRPDFRPVGWVVTDRATRHGRPVRGWRATVRRGSPVGR